jgi:predicted RecB family endonuclease
MVNEKEILKKLEEGGVSLPPLEIRLSSRDNGPSKAEVDAIIEVSWGEQQEEFAVEFKAQSTPKILSEVIYKIKTAARDMGRSPMIIVPYLDEDALKVLERQGVSGLDLCGNGIVVVPDRLFVYRTGNFNQFPSSAPIKNIYRKNTSMVARLFLVRPRFNLVKEIMEEINRRNRYEVWAEQGMALSTVSKALKGLQDDLIVGQKDSKFKLLQAEKLLDRLSKNYVEPKVGQTINWRVPSGRGESKELLKDAFLSRIPAVVTGIGSVSRYAVMQSPDTLRIYSPDPKQWLAGFPGTQTDRFPTLLVIQTEDASVYFDARDDEGIVWASPIQTYLELMKGDKRDQETAIQVKDLILRRLREEPL